MVEAAASKVNDFDTTFRWMPKKDVLTWTVNQNKPYSNNYNPSDLWFQVTVHDTVMPHEGQRQQHLACETTDEGSRKSYEAIGLDQLVQVDTEEFHGDAQMVSEIEMFRHFDNMMFFIGILKRRLTYQLAGYQRIIRTHLRRLSRILISTNA